MDALEKAEQIVWQHADPLNLKPIISGLDSACDMLLLAAYGDHGPCAWWRFWCRCPRKDKRKAMEIHFQRRLSDAYMNGTPDDMIAVLDEYSKWRHGN